MGEPIYEEFGGGWTWRIEPAERRAGEHLTFCLVCHGSGGYVRENESDWLRPQAGGRATVERLFAAGFLVGMSHAAGEAWGNSDAQGQCVAFIEGLRKRYDLAPQVVIVGRSMGGPLAVNLALGALAGQVARLALLQPVCDLAHMTETPRNDGVHAAYGRPPMERWAETVAPFCPLSQVRALTATTVGADPRVGPSFASVESGPTRGSAPTARPPTMVWHNRSDPVCPVSFAEDLAVLWRKAGGRMALHLLPGEGHTVYGQEPVASEVAEFMCGGFAR